jgi:hypothetical protein
MRFQVPQFIDIEDKIVGPLSLNQFIYIAGNAALAFVSYRLIPVAIIGILLGAAFITFGLLLAFYKHNNRPLIHLVSAMVNFAIKPKLYIWKPRPKKEDTVIDFSSFKPTNRIVTVAKNETPSTSKLSDMSWQLDMEPQ